MKKIMILFQMGSEVRQFGHSGFIDELIRQGWQVTIASHMSSGEWMSQLPSAVRFVPLPPAKTDVFSQMLSSALDQAQAERRKKLGLSIWVYGEKSPTKSFRQWLRRGFQSVLGKIFINPLFFHWGQSLESMLIRMRGAPQYERFLAHQSPDAIVVNVPRFGTQTFLLAAAKLRNIPCFLFFHTNKDVVALSRFDHHFTEVGVWNDWMKEQVISQNSMILKDKVSITGCAHFDCIGQANYLSSEIEFRARLGIEEDVAIVLYTTAGPGVLPEEERFIDVVKNSLDALPSFVTQLVIRLNPMDDSPRLGNYLKEHCPKAIILRPDWHYSRTQNLCYQKKEDVLVWNDLLHYSAVCINIPSTVTIECALVGLPVINLGFDLPGPKPLPGSVRAFWDVDYYTNVRNTGAALFAEKVEILPDLIWKTLENRHLLISEQEKLIAQELNEIYPSQAVLHYIEVLEKQTNR